MSNSPSGPEQTVRAVQIITIAMVIGVVMFAGVAVFAAGALGDPPEGSFISAVAAGFAVMAFLMHLVVPAIIAKQQTRGANETQLYDVYRTKTIIGLAILEGAAFLNIVVTIIEHNWWSLAIVGGLVFWMLAMFPTRTRVAQWVETQQMLNDT